MSQGCLHRGVFVLLLPTPSTAPRIPVQKPSVPYHITLLIKAELRTSKESPQFTSNEKYMLPSLGTYKEVYFLPVLSPAIQQFRKKLGFERKDLHVTLSAADNPDVAKDIHCVLSLDLRSLSEKQFNMAFLASRPSPATHLALAYRAQYPKSPAGHIRVAGKHAADTSNSSIHVHIVIDSNEKTKVYVTNKPCRCSLKQSFCQSAHRKRS